MSIARKCNKCRKCFDPFDMRGQMASFQNPIFRTSMDIKEHFHGEFLDEAEGADGIIDLCPDCARKFRVFMDPNVNELPVKFPEFAILNDKSNVKMKIPPDDLFSDTDGDVNPAIDIVRGFTGTNFSNPNMK